MRVAARPPEGRRARSAGKACKRKDLAALRMRKRTASRTERMALLALSNGHRWRSFGRRGFAAAFPAGLIFSVASPNKGYRYATAGPVLRIIALILSLVLTVDCVASCTQQAAELGHEWHGGCIGRMPVFLLGCFQYRIKSAALDYIPRRRYSLSKILF